MDQAINFDVRVIKISILSLIKLFICIFRLNRLIFETQRAKSVRHVEHNLKEPQATKKPNETILLFIKFHANF
jgi:hypothetical protein